MRSRVKKISIPLFLVLLLLMHLGKYVVYLHCEVKNFISTGQPHCDCEKQITNYPDINQANNALKNNWKEKGPEDFFALVVQVAQEKKQSGDTPHSYSGSFGLSTGFHSGIFQPPKSQPSIFYIS